jgi:alkylation response protein AidB-like acyl-CoA dehydrogenase
VLASPVRPKSSISISWNRGSPWILAFTPEDRAFQKEVRDWIAENYTPDLRAKSAASKNGYLDKEGQVAWQKKLYEGWVAPNWPVEYGGPGLSATERYILNMELSSAGTPPVARWASPWLRR